ASRGAEREVVAMRPLGNDRWSAWIGTEAVGWWEFEVLGLPDEWGTFARDLRRRFDAGQDLSVELLVGVAIVAGRLRRRPEAEDAAALRALRDTVADAGRPDAERVAAVEDPEAAALLRRTADWASATVAGPWPLFVDRELAGFSAWYEMFPRSEGAVPEEGRSGTFATAARRLPAIAAMGFDVVYLPPVHPVGRSHRKGRNNVLEAGPLDPGSPWAIGGAGGGHDAVHPDLGTVEDFEAFADAARAEGLEVAIDFAIQSSPDHPWVTAHPDWFRHRPDGSIRSAENPPKRYQDIYPVDFDTPDRAGLDAELLRLLLLWVERGVRIFRVDNPHTKPLRMWRWLIAEVRRRHPDVLFLSEAFTRPRIMERLAKDGFTQSYTYFTWRNSKPELSEYLTELSQTPIVDYMRPNFWTNTPDILHEVLQSGGPPAFRLRAVLAALCCPSWGMYSGYELCENVPLREGSEEYWESEKYQLRPRDWDRPDSLAPFVTLLNAVRRRHRAAVAQPRTLRVHHVDGDHLLAVSRTDHAHRDTLLVVVNLDPSTPRAGMTWLDLDVLGVDPAWPFACHDELTGDDFTWDGPSNYVRLDPAVQPAHVLHVRQ
ncbi:MAG TPA: maltotransferase domain-containing protein, partial [Candidatus Dormibacteraeota bacterium]|nr:maltotransferase domain-containing protein [Candidatus Dormibacteraeota bacterium]